MIIANKETVDLSKRFAELVTMNTKESLLEAFQIAIEIINDISNSPFIFQELINGERGLSQQSLTNYNGRLNFYTSDKHNKMYDLLQEFVRMTNLNFVCDLDNFETEEEEEDNDEEEE